jgi:hypothetical protein
MRSTVLSLPLQEGFPAYFKSAIILQCFCQAAFFNFCSLSVQNIVVVLSIWLFYRENMFGFSILYLQRSMLLTSLTDPRQQFSAPFKAGNSRQAQTCYIPQNTTQRKIATLSGSY